MLKTFYSCVFVQGSITVPLTSCLTGLDWSVLQIKTKIVSCHTANSKPVKQEVNGTVILPPLVFPGLSLPPFSNICGYGLTRACGSEPTRVAPARSQI